MHSSDQAALVKHFALVAGWIILLYALLILVSRLLVPPFHGEVIDTSRAWETPYSTSQKLVYYGRDALVGPRDRVIIIGASNAQLGISARLAGEVLPEHAVHNLSVVSANVTVMRQLADIAIERIGSDDVADDIFVLGVWYGSFVSDAYRWNATEGEKPVTLLDEEAMRFGFTSRLDNGDYFDRVPDEYLGAAQLFAYPLIALDRMMRVATGTRTFPDEAYMNSVELTDEMKEGNIEIRKQEMGGLPLDPMQFKKLDMLIRVLNALDAKVIVVNLPIPEWHKAVSPYHAGYVEQITERMSHHEHRPGFTYVDISDLDDDAWFYDDAHLRPSHRSKWIERLAPALTAAANGDGASVSEFERKTDVTTVQ